MAELPAAEPAAVGGPPVRYTTYYTQRFQGEDGNRVLYFLQDESKTTATLAVAGHDPRGTGHFTYISTPEMQGVAPPLKCTNRCKSAAPPVHDRREVWFTWRVAAGHKRSHADTYAACVLLAGRACWHGWMASARSLALLLKEQRCRTSCSANCRAPDTAARGSPPSDGQQTALLRGLRRGERRAVTTRAACPTKSS